MISRFPFPLPESERDASREVQLLSFISQIFIQPFSPEENLLALLTALTSGWGVGFNRAMLFLAEAGTMKGRLWLGPRTFEEAKAIWGALSTPGIGFAEVVEYNRGLLKREKGGLSDLIRGLSYDLDSTREVIPSLASCRREIILVGEASSEPLVDRAFRDTIRVEEFLCIPLLSREEVLGEIILDNAFTRSAIGPRDIQLAGLCGLIAGNYLYTSRLLRRMMDMEKMAALGEMGLFIAHQLRNPLAVIGGFTDQLLRYRLSEKKKKRNLTIIRSEIKRLEKVLVKIGRLTQIETQPAVALDLQRLIQDLLAQAEVRLKARGRQIQVLCPQSLPTILGHPLAVAEALHNVLDNALEASAWGGLVELRCEPRGPGWVVLAVKDNGPGFPAEVRDKMFRPFFTTKKKGIGLGLTFVKRVMDIHGGRVEVDSSPGRGTEVQLFFKAGGGP